MNITDIPDYLLKPLPRSRVNGHLQSMGMWNMRTDAGFATEFAICEHVFAIRRYTATTREWSKWVDHALTDHAAAVEKAKQTMSDLVRRHYYSVVSTGLILPLNETDVRHLRSDGMLPRAMLDYGSDTFRAITDWRQSEIDRKAPPAPAVAPAPATTMPAPIAPRPVTSTPAPDMDSVLGKLRTAGAALDRSKDF